MRIQSANKKRVDAAEEARTKRTETKGESVRPPEGTGDRAGGSGLGGQDAKRTAARRGSDGRRLRGHRAERRREA